MPLGGPDTGGDYAGPPWKGVEDHQAVVAQIQQEIRDWVESNVVGLSVKEQIEKWNAGPLDRRKRTAAHLLGSRYPGDDQVADVRFEAEQFEGDPRCEITVLMTTPPSIERAYINGRIE